MPTDAAKDAQASPAAAEAPATDDLETARKAVEDTAAIGGGLWLSYLFVLFYLGIAAGAVTHADLLLQAPVKLPFLNIDPNGSRLTGNEREAKQVIFAWVGEEDMTPENTKEWRDAIAGISRYRSL